MRNSILVFTVICTLIMFSYGCGENGTFGGGNSNQAASAYSTGTQGIVLDFLENSPPADLYDQQTYPFSVELYNKGSSDTNPYMTLSGFDKNIIHVDWTNRQVGLIPKRSIEYPEGGYGYLTDNVRITLPQEATGIPTTIMATACYDYETSATIQICVDPNPASNKDDVCEAKSFTISGGQSAPVAITGVAQQECGWGRCD
jgi:hypothetical protein